MLSFGKTTLLLVLALCMAQAKEKKEVIYDKDFWEGFDSEEPYNHTWSNIPDLIDNQTVSFYFNETRYFL